jgi:hypothetical protein
MIAPGGHGGRLYDRTTPNHDLVSNTGVSAARGSDRSPLPVARGLVQASPRPRRRDRPDDKSRRVPQDRRPTVAFVFPSDAAPPAARRSEDPSRRHRRGPRRQDAHGAEEERAATRF